MKILFYVNSFLPKIGGREIVTYYLAKSLLELGHEVRIFGPIGFRRNRKIKCDIPIHRWPSLRNFAYEKIWGLNLYLDAKIWGCDVIHAHATNPSGFIASKVKKIAGCPLIITPHGSDIQIIPGINYGQRMDPQKNKKIIKALSAADKITAISKGIEKSILSVGIRSNRISIVGNGVDLKRFRRNKVNGCSELKNKKVIVTVGNYRLCKGHEIIINSMKDIIKEFPNAMLVIVGGGTDVLKPIIASNNLNRHVKLTGSVSIPFINSEQIKKEELNSDHDLLAEIYSAGYVYVSAGIDEGAEGFPLTTLEAMAAGLPVVATNISGNKDVVQNRINGFIVEPNNVHSLTNGLKKILGNENLRHRMGLYARKTAEKYSWKTIAKSYIKIYEEAISKNTKIVKK